VLSIDVRATHEAPWVYDASAEKNVVAAFDGVVTKIVAMEGTPAVQVGDVVQAGDVLIWGYEQRGGNLVRRAALGEVWADTTWVGEGNSSLFLEKQVKTGRIAVNRHFKTPWCCVIIEGGEGFAHSQTEVTKIPLLDGLFFGAWVERQTVYETKPILQAEPYESVKAAARQSAYDAAIHALPLGCIAGEDSITYTIDAETATVQARVVLRANLQIGK